MAPSKIRHRQKAWVRNSTRWLLFGSLVGLVLSGCHSQQSSPKATLTPEAAPEMTPEATPTPTPKATPALTDIQEQVLQPGDRRYTIAIPAGYTDDQPVPLVLALHYGGPVTPYYGKGFLVGLVEPALRELGAIIIAPDCTADDWIQPESEDDVLALLDHVQATYNVDPQKTLITGYSMGGTGTWHLAARHQDRFAAALPMASRPGAPAVNAQWDIPIYVIHGEEDEIFPLAMTAYAVNKLQEGDVSIELVTLEGITHYETIRFIEPLREAVPWIEKAWAR